MTRKAGLILVVTLALSVAALGLFLCARCERGKAPPVDTLTVEGVQAE